MRTLCPPFKMNPILIGSLLFGRHRTILIESDAYREENGKRIGVLGAARITPSALIQPAGKLDGVEVAAVAARDVGRARRFAEKHHIGRVHSSYGDLLEDPDIDAIYNPLPNSHHAEWTIRALEAGKHVLCEKPLASNAAEARRMAESAESSGKNLATAYHWYYHPLANRVGEILASGELGRIREVEAVFFLPLIERKNIRWQFELAGGSMMDLGGYAVSILEFLAGGRPEVREAQAKVRVPQVDSLMEAALDFPGGVTGRLSVSLAKWFSIGARVVGETGSLQISNPVLPQIYNRLVLNTSAGIRREKIPGEATYFYQLKAFHHWCAGGEPMVTDGRYGAANMETIDAVYRAAGLRERGI